MILGPRVGVAGIVLILSFAVLGLVIFGPGLPTREASVARAALPETASREHREQEESDPLTREGIELGAGVRSSLETAPAEPSKAREGTILLHVVDAETHEKLRDVRVVHNPREGVPLRTPQRFHPGPHAGEHGWASAAVAPLLLQLGPGPGTQYWVGAVGYAWSGLSLPASAVGERTVSLRPAGELDVMVLGVPPGYEANLQILALDETHPLLLEHLVRGEVHFAFDGWRPGSFRCQLAVGRDTEAHVLADERVEVRVGQRSSTTLIFPERHDEGPGGSVDGVLAMPESEFDLGDLAAELSLVLLPEAPGQLQLARSSYALTRRLDAMERTPMGADARLWRFDDVPPGDYVLLVRPLGLTRALRVEPGRALHVELELPPLAHSRVRWTRTAGGRGVRLAELSTTLAEETVRELGAFDVRQQFVEADGTYVLTSVPGRLRLCALESDMTPRVEEIDAASGWNDFEFLLGAPPRITLDLQLDGQAYAVDLAFWFGVEVAPVVTGHRLLAVLAKGEEHGGRPANHHAAYDFSERGSFHFVFPALEGFDPIAPRTLSTDSPEPATIELVRRP